MVLVQYKCSFDAGEEGMCLSQNIGIYSSVLIGFMKVTIQSFHVFLICHADFRPIQQGRNDNGLVDEKFCCVLMSQ